MARRTAVAAILALSACSGAERSRATQQGVHSEEAAQAEAELLGREVADIVDRVMAYKSAHQGKLPQSFRQAGLDTLTSQFTRHLGRDGADPLVTITFRQTEGRELRSCSGTNAVLEDKLLRAGSFDVNCTLAGGATRTFTVPPPPPPKK